jgi:hypothetical protein
MMDLEDIWESEDVCASLKLSMSLLEEKTTKLLVSHEA